MFTLLLKKLCFCSCVCSSFYHSSLLKWIFRESKQGVFIVNFEHISHLVLVFLLLTLNMQLPAGRELELF